MVDYGAKPSSLTLWSRSTSEQSSAPVLKTPTEILSYIFLLATQDNHRSRLEMPLLVASICRRFRAVALNTPSLWTSICMRDHRPDGPFFFEGDALWLKRSKACPLDICMDFCLGEQLDCDDGDEDDELGYLTVEDLNLVMDLLVPHASRWKTFHLACDSYLPFYLITKRLADVDVPILTTIEFVRTVPYVGPTWQFFPEQLSGSHPFLKSAPKLRRAAFQGVHIDWGQTGMRNLQELTLSRHAGTVMPTPSDFTALLTANPNLESLDLTASGPALHMWSDDDEVTPLPALRALEVGYISAEYALALFKAYPAPNITSLSLKPMSGLRGAGDVSPLLNFIAKGSLCAAVTDLALDAVTASRAAYKNAFPSVERVMLKNMHAEALWEMPKLREARVLDKPAHFKPLFEFKLAHPKVSVLVAVPRRPGDEGRRRKDVYRPIEEYIKVRSDKPGDYEVVLGSCEEQSAQRSLLRHGDFYQRLLRSSVLGIN